MPNSARRSFRRSPLGNLRLAFAHTERQSGWDLFDVASSARKDGAGYVLNGEKGLVLHGDSATRLIVSARISGGQRERAGLGLFLVDAAAPGWRGAAIDAGRTDARRRSR